MAKKKQMKGWQKLVLHLAAMVAIVAIVLIVLFRWMNSYTHHGEYISVPDIAGLAQDDAALELAHAGLRCEASDFRYEPGMEEGQVIEQRPEAGSYVKENRIIHLTVNSGKIPMKEVPDVADNSSLRAAQSKLEAAGFKLTETEFIPGDKDWVYEVRMDGRTLTSGEQIPEGSTLTIVAGSGEDSLEDLSDSADNVLDADFF